MTAVRALEEEQRVRGIDDERVLVGVDPVVDEVVVPRLVGPRRAGVLREQHRRGRC